VIAIGVVFLVGAEAPNAFAGWKASPTPPASGQVQAALAVCRQRLGGAALSGSGKAIDPSAWRLTLGDTRGPFSPLLLTAHNGTILCISNPTFTSLTNGPPSVGKPIAADAIAVERSSHSDRDGQAYTLIEGKTGADVTGTTLILTTERASKQAAGVVRSSPGDPGDRVCTQPISRPAAASRPNR
jgi:hypothetical protein